MALAILHLSDIHFRENDSHIQERALAVRAALQSRCTGLSAILLLFSGDLAYSGKRSEYQVASSFIDALLNELRVIPGVEIIGPAIVPGNHDCDFEIEGDVRPQLLTTLPNRLDSLDPEGQSVVQITRVQDAFFSFEECYSKQPRQNASRLHYSYHYRHNNRNIQVHCVNTAWVSRLKEQPGQLLVPNFQISKTEELPDLILTVFHHPYAWLETTNRREFRRLVESSSDIVLTGHEHDGDAYARDSSLEEHVHYVEGAAFQASGTDTGFNFLVVDLDQRSYQVSRFLWAGDVYEPEIIKEAVFIRNPSLLKQYFENSPGFKKELQQLGAAFSHPNKRFLEVDDLFVYPDLRTRSILDKTDKLVSGQNVVDFVASQKYLNISGGSMSGKTTLGKKLYVDLQEKLKLVPILLSAKELKGKAEQSLIQSTERAFSHQYFKERLEDYHQLEPGKKVLIVDDWQSLQFNSKWKAAFLSVAKKAFGIIMTLSTDGSWFQELLDLETSEVTDFRYCEIKEFGFRLRSQLVTKWHTLGREFELDEAEATHRISESEHLLENVIGKNLVPSYPFFILYVLQVIELDNQSTLTCGSYGHVYEALLTARLVKVSAKTSDLGAKYTYLSLMAYRLFDTDKKALTAADLREIHDIFTKEYGIPVDRERMIGELEEARILGRSGEDVYFQYKYCYYYFVAKYFQKALADKSDDQIILEKLRSMADMVHDDDYMNILIFYIYLTEDRKLIEYIIDKARRVYDEYAPCNLDHDVDFIADLYNPPTLDVGNGDVRKNREEYFARKDELSQDSNVSHTSTVRQRYDRSLQDVLKTEFAFKSLQVMGQVLRNFPGELKADLKLQLANESYQLGLRALKSFLKTIEIHAEEFRLFVERNMLKFCATSRNDASKDAGQVVAFLALASIYGMIKRISFSVGLEELRETYEALRKTAGECNTPTRLIDLAIHLDHFPKIPMRDIEDLEASLSSSPIAYNTLRILVADYLYLFPVNYKDRQRLTALFRFDRIRSLLADKKVKQLSASN